MTDQAHQTNTPLPRRHYVKKVRKPRRLMTTTNRSSQRLVGPAAIADYMLNDPLMIGVVLNLVVNGRLGHHYENGVLCSTRTACRLCMARIERDVVEGDQGVA